MNENMIIKWRCNIFRWTINITACLGVIIFNCFLFADSLDNMWLPGVLIFLFIVIVASYQLVCMPLKIEIYGNFLLIIWPWWTYRVQKDQTRSIAIKQYWLKTVHVLIKQEKTTFYNFFPILLSWELKQENEPNIAASIQAWWTERNLTIESPILTNCEVSLRRMYQKTEKLGPPENTTNNV